MADAITSMYPHPTSGIDTLKIVTPAASGIDPAVAALMAGNKGGGLFGTGSDGILPLLIGAFLFGGRGLGGLGGFGAAGYPGPVAGAGAFAAEAVAAQSIFTPKDTSLQLSSFQNWAQTNSAQLAQQCGCSTQQILTAINGLNQSMFQTFIAQAQAQTAQLNNMQSTLTQQATVNSDAINQHINTMEDNLNNDVHDVEKSIAAGFAASELSECQTQNLVNMTSAQLMNALTVAIKDGNYSLAQQLAACCCENRLAIANQNALIERNTALLSNQVNLQTCEIKTAIRDDGAATRALINANTVQDLETQLADAKSATRDATLLAAIGNNGHHRRGGDSDSGSVNNTINITDIAAAVARALNQSGTASSTLRSV